MSARTRVELDWPTHNAIHVGGDVYFCLERAGQVFVIRSRCAHRGGPLHLGVIEQERLRCPWHGNAFRVDRLCEGAVPTVRRGSRIVAYPPAEPAVEASATRQIVLAR